MRGFPPLGRRTIALSLSLLVAVTGLPAAGAAQAPTPGSLAAGSPAVPAFALPDPGSWEADAAQPTDDAVVPVTSVDIGAAASHVDGLAATLPATDWAIAALAEHLDYDPERAFAFVRDSIGFDAYAGVLRGPGGTLAARAGNAWDRALLLSALLDAMLVRNRIVHAPLAPDRAAAVVARTFARPIAPLPEGPLDPTELGDLDALRARAARDHARLRGVLGDRVARMDGSDGAAALADVTDHAWVQTMAGPDWRDLDPTLPEARPGEVLARGATGAAEIPERLRHRVRLVLSAESIDAGVLTERVVLDQVLDAARDAGRDIHLTLEPRIGGLGGGIAEALGSATEWVPRLYLDDGEITGEPFPVRPGSDLFEGTESGPELTAIRLGITVEGPGQAPLEVQRVLLDRVPAEQRGHPEAVDPTLLTPLRSEGGLPVELTAVHHLQLSTGGFDARAHLLWRSIAIRFAGLSLVDESFLADKVMPEILLPLTVADEALVLGSERLVKLGLDTDPDVRGYVARPRVFLSSIGPAPDGVSLQTDLLADDVRILVRGTRTAGDAAALRIWYGVLEGALETQLGLKRSPVASAGEGTRLSTSLATRDALTLVADAASLPSDAVPALAAEVAAGGLAAIPGDPASARAWWSVDPARGVTRAMLAPGLGGYGDYVNSVVNEGERIAVRGINDPVATRAQLDRLAQQAARSLERPRPPSTGCTVGGQEYSMLVCIAIIAAAGLFLIGLVLAIRALIASVSIGLAPATVPRPA